MASNTDLLQQLTSGNDLTLMADVGALESAKMGLMVVTGILLAAALYLALTQLGILGGVKKSLFAWLGAALALGVSFLLYQKQQDFADINPNEPLLAVTRTAIGFPQKNLTLLWKDIEQVELIEEKRLPKQATQELVTQTVRLKFAKDADNKGLWIGSALPQEVRTMYDRGYYIIDHETLNVEPALLAKALENYRKGL